MREANAIKQREWKVMLLLFGLALGVRITYLLLFERDYTPEADAFEYDNYAGRIATGWAWLNQHIPYVSHRPPVYPLLLGIIYALFGHSYLAAQIVQAFVSAGSVVLIYYLARELFSSRVALGAALWAVPYIFFLQYACFLLRETLLILLLLVLVILLLQVLREHQKRDVFFLGLVFCLLIHTDPRYLFYLPFLLLWMLLSYANWKQSLQEFGVFLGVVILLSGPWLIRNYLVYDAFVPICLRTMPSFRIFYTRNADTPEEYAQWQAGSPGKREPQPPAPPGRPPSEPTSENQGEGPPGMQPARGPAAQLWFNFREFWRPVRFRGEYRANSRIFDKPWSRPHNLSSLFCYGLLLPFLAGGMVGIIKQGPKERWILLLPILAQFALHLFKWGKDRYRLPIDPFIIIVAGAALGALWEWKRRRDMAPTPPSTMETEQGTIK